MLKNAHLAPQLDAYEALKEPGFALMVDAPWGAGKTHTIKSWLGDRKHLYVSLYGMKSREDVERAILLERIGLIDNGTARAVMTLVSAGAEALAAHYNIKAMIKPDKLAQIGLPDLIVFDDLERIEMEGNELLSILNRYVEHEQKNVILLVNQGELRKKAGKGYNKAKEKIVGRTIAISPDVPAALEAFLKDLTDQAGKKAGAFLKENADQLQTVFATTESQNLRLLRQSILEFSRFYYQIPNEMRANVNGMRLLVSTFISLSIAFNSGTISEKDLGQDVGLKRALWEANGRKGAEPPKSGLEVLQEQFVSVPEVRLDGSVLSPVLAKEWIVQGYASDEKVARELGNSVPFSTEDTEPWRTLWYWPLRATDQVKQAIVRLKIQLDAYEIVDPLVLMHVAGILIDLGYEKLEWPSPKAALMTVSSYFEGLSQRGRLDPNWPKRRADRSLRDDSAFGLGFHRKTSPEFRKLRDKLTAALDLAFWESNPERVNKLFELMLDNPEGFAEAIGNEGRRGDKPNYAYDPILTGIAPAEAARQIFALPSQDIITVLRPFKDRYTRLWSMRAEPGKGPDECQWMRQFKVEAIAAAEMTGGVRTAQLRKIIGWNLSFLDGT